MQMAILHYSNIKKTTFSEREKKKENTFKNTKSDKVCFEKKKYFSYNKICVKYIQRIWTIDHIMKNWHDMLTTKRMRKIQTRASGQ